MRQGSSGRKPHDGGDKPARAVRSRPIPNAVLKLVELPPDSEAPARLDIIAGDAKASLEISGWCVAMLVVTGSNIIERRGCGPIRMEDLDAYDTARSLIDDLTSADPFAAGGGAVDG